MPISNAERKQVINQNLAAEHGGARPSRRQRINLQCKDCIYDPKGQGLGTWRQQTEACGDTGCPLWPLRPKSTSNLVDSVAEKTPNSTVDAL